MTLQEAISVLTIHQQWRMGEEIPMLEPKIISEAINIILDNHLHNQLEETVEEKMHKFFNETSPIELVEKFEKIGVEFRDETVEEAAEKYAEKYDGSMQRYLGFIAGTKWQKEQIIQFLYDEITERRDYSASKMCEVIIEFINK